MTFILFVTCIFTPLNIAFDYHTRDHTVETIDYSIDFIYFIDILVIFNTAYYDHEQQLVLNRKKIACKYLRGWFAIDLLSIIPFSAFLEQS